MMAQTQMQQTPANNQAMQSVKQPMTGNTAMPMEKKKGKWWIWLIVVLVLIGIGVYFWLM